MNESHTELTGVSIDMPGGFVRTVAWVDVLGNAAVQLGIFYARAVVVALWNPTKLLFCKVRLGEEETTRERAEALVLAQRVLKVVRRGSVPAKARWCPKVFDRWRSASVVPQEEP